MSPLHNAGGFSLCLIVYFNDVCALGNSDYIPSSICMLNNWKVHGNVWLWPNLCYPGCCVKGLKKKPNKILDKDSICCGQDSKWEPQEYKTDTLWMETTFFFVSKCRQFRVQSFLRCPKLQEQGSAVVWAACQRRSQHIGTASRWLHSAQESW